MAVKHHMVPGYGPKQTVRIMTVDPATRRVEATLKDGAMIQIRVFDVPTIFRWPKPEELWTVRRDSGLWVLDARIEHEQDGLGLIEDMEPGQTKITGTTTITGNLNVQGAFIASGSATAEGSIGTFATRPSAATVGNGGRFFATDVVADYISDGTTWRRINTAAGIEQDFKGASVPTGYVQCDGSAYSTTGVYTDLYAAIGTTYDTQDGKTAPGAGQFRVPDSRGRVAVGLAYIIAGETGPPITDVDALIRSDGLVIASRTVKHVHNIPDHAHSFSGTTGNQSQDHTHTMTTGNPNNDHTHGFTSGGISANHTHIPGNGASFMTTGTSFTFSGSGGGSMNTTGSTGTVSSDHVHSGTTGTVSAQHVHSGTTSGMSVSHTHSFSGTAGSGTNPSSGTLNTGSTGSAYSVARKIIKL